jgi:hypothetical protein
MKVSSNQSGILQHACPEQIRSDKKRANNERVSDKNLWRILKREEKGINRTELLSRHGVGAEAIIVYIAMPKSLRLMRKAICRSEEIFLSADPGTGDSCHNFAAGREYQVIQPEGGHS